MNGPERPVSRWRVLAGALIAAALLAGLLTTLELLRHPAPDLAGEEDEAQELALDESDPRMTTECEEAEPREGQGRTSTEATGSGDPMEGGEPLPVTSSQLYDCPDLWDGVRVTYTGEVIGAVLRRHDGAWVHLNDDIYADLRGPLPVHRDYRGGNAGTGVYIPLELADQIRWVGGPDTVGDRITVTGTFLRVDPATSEVAIIRADDGIVEQVGSRVESPVLRDRRRFAFAAAVIAIAVTALERFVARRR